MITKLSGACYAVRSMVHISNTDTLKSIYYAFFGGDSSNTGKIYKSKVLELWLVHNPEPLVEVYLNN